MQSILSPSLSLFIVFERFTKGVMLQKQKTLQLPVIVEAPPVDPFVVLLLLLCIPPQNSTNIERTTSLVVL